MAADPDTQQGGAPVLLWLRRALRLRDNPALELALTLANADGSVGAGDRGRVAGCGGDVTAVGGGGLIPVYVMDEGTNRWTTGAASRRWLSHSLLALDLDLRRCGSRLLIRSGPANVEIPALVAETGARRVVADRRWEPAWVARDRTLADALGRIGAQMHTVITNLLFDPESVATRDGRPFTTFTPYWRACRQLPEPGAGSDAPDRLPEPSRWPRGQETISPPIAVPETWEPGERGAARRLTAFLE